jgi:hypothetical protein
MRDNRDLPAMRETRAVLLTDVVDSTALVARAGA